MARGFNAGETSGFGAREVRGKADFERAAYEKLKSEEANEISGGYDRTDLDVSRMGLDEVSNTSRDVRENIFRAGYGDKRAFDSSTGKFKEGQRLELNQEFDELQDSLKTGKFKEALEYALFSKIADKFAGEEMDYHSLETDDDDLDRTAPVDFEKLNLGTMAVKVKVGDAVYRVVVDVPRADISKVTFGTRLNDDGRAVLTDEVDYNLDTLDYKVLSAEKEAPHERFKWSDVADMINSPKDWLDNNMGRALGKFVDPFTGRPQYDDSKKPQSEAALKERMEKLKEASFKARFNFIKDEVKRIFGVDIPNPGSKPLSQSSNLDWRKSVRNVLNGLAKPDDRRWIALAEAEHFLEKADARVKDAFKQYVGDREKVFEEYSSRAGKEAESSKQQRASREAAEREAAYEKLKPKKPAKIDYEGGRYSRETRDGWKERSDGSGWEIP